MLNLFSVSFFWWDSNNSHKIEQETALKQSPVPNIRYSMRTSNFPQIIPMLVMSGAESPRCHLYTALTEMFSMSANYKDYTISKNGSSICNIL